MGGNLGARRWVGRRPVQEARLSRKDSLDSRRPLWHFPAARTCSGQVCSPGKGPSVPPMTSFFRVRRCARDGRPALHRAVVALHYASGCTPALPTKRSPRPTRRCAFSRSDAVFGHRLQRTSQIAVTGHASCCGDGGPEDLVIRSNGSLRRTDVGANPRRTALCILGIARAVAPQSRRSSGRRGRRQRSCSVGRSIGDWCCSSWSR